MTVADALFDNPILKKHLRSRLRPVQSLPWAVVLVSAAACIVYAGHNINWFGDTSALRFLLGIQIFALAFGGSNQITASLGGARESGILDFHRVSPVPPLVVSLGFLVGAPVREYALAALLVPFVFFSASLIDAADTWSGVAWAAQVEVAVLTTTWVGHAVAMLGALTRKKPRSSVVGGFVTFFFLLILLYLGSIGFYLGTQWLLEGDRRLNAFGRLIPWLPWTLAVELPVLGFLCLAVTRKMGAERSHAYTKWQALACMATLTALLVGGLWGLGRHLPPVPATGWTPADVISIAAVYALSLTAMILAMTVTPDAGGYVRGVRRALREGRRRPSPWSDAGSNRVALFALCAIVLAGSTTVVNVLGTPPLIWPVVYANGVPVNTSPTSDAAWLASRQSLASRPIVVGVLTAAYVGLGLQFFSLRTRRSGAVLTMLFLFFAWLAPMVAGAFLGMGGPDQTGSLTVIALSPIAGLALSCGLGLSTGADSIRLAALAPPITFAFVFNSLLVFTQRKIDKQLRTREKAPATGPVPGLE